jgi:hypothetical protein
VAVESIQELEKQKREIPEAYRFIVLEEEYEALQEKCKEETLTYYGEVTPFIEDNEGDFVQQPDEQQSDDQQSDLNTDDPSNRPNDTNDLNRPNDNEDTTNTDDEADTHLNNNQDTDNTNKDNTDVLAPAVLRGSGEAAGGYSDEDINDEENETSELPEENIEYEDTDDPDNQHPDLNTDDPSNSNKDNTDVLAPAVLRGSGEAAGGYDESLFDPFATVTS